MAWNYATTTFWKTPWGKKGGKSGGKTILKCLRKSGGKERVSGFPGGTQKMESQFFTGMRPTGGGGGGGKKGGVTVGLTKNTQDPGRKKRL